VTAVGDLRRWRRDIPDSVAITAGCTDSSIRYITYEEYAQYVERLAGALHELGVGPGQVVAIQLPNWWQTSALVLACARLGAVIAPVATTIRPHELESILAMLRASVCVTVDRWADFDHSAALADIATRLPHLRHRVVLGENVRTGELDFALHFEHMPWEKRHGISLDDPGEDPDQVWWSRSPPVVPARRRPCCTRSTPSTPATHRSPPRTSSDRTTDCSLPIH
jgi:cyclohexanecarboxylate-CoA ligase